MIRSLFSSCRSAPFRSSSPWLGQNLGRLCTNVSTSSEKPQDEEKRSFDKSLAFYHSKPRLSQNNACFLAIEMAQQAKDAKAQHSKLYEAIKSTDGREQPKIIERMVKALENSLCEDVETKTLVSSFDHAPLWIIFQLSKHHINYNLQLAPNP